MLYTVFVTCSFSFLFGSPGYLHRLHNPCDHKLLMGLPSWQNVLVRSKRKFTEDPVQSFQVLQSPVLQVTLPDALWVNTRQHTTSASVVVGHLGDVCPKAHQLFYLHLDDGAHLVPLSN